MTDLDASLRTVGALVAQRAMIDYAALDELVGPYRADHIMDDSEMVRSIDNLLSRLGATPPEDGGRMAAKIAGRGAKIANAGTQVEGDQLRIGEGLVALAKIVDDSGDLPSFSGRAGECIRILVRPLPRGVSKG